MTINIIRLKTFRVLHIRSFQYEIVNCVQIAKFFFKSKFIDFQGFGAVASIVVGGYKGNDLFVIINCWSGHFYGVLSLRANWTMSRTVHQNMIQGTSGGGEIREKMSIKTKRLYVDVIINIQCEYIRKFTFKLLIFFFSSFTSSSIPKGFNIDDLRLFISVHLFGILKIWH